MQSLNNIEKSKFHPGQYVGYSNGLVFHIKKTLNGWTATDTQFHVRRTAPTLALLSEALENLTLLD